MKRSLLALMTLTLLAACGGQPAATTNSPASLSDAAPGGGTFLTVALPPDVLSLPLVDQQGTHFTLGALHGRYVVITNFMTSCQDICPMTTANMRRIGDAVKSAGLAKQVQVLELSIDAQRDTPARMKAYQALYGSGGAWSLATGSRNDLQHLWTFFGAPPVRVNLTAQQMAGRPKDWQTGQPVTYDMSHADLVLILDPSGTWRWLDLGAPQTADGRIPQRLQRFLTDDGKLALARPQQPTWTVEAVLSALSTLTGTTIKP